jgi:hypothetical protein
MLKTKVQGSRIFKKNPPWRHSSFCLIFHTIFFSLFFFLFPLHYHNAVEENSILFYTYIYLIYWFPPLGLEPVTLGAASKHSKLPSWEFWVLDFLVEIQLEEFVTRGKNKAISVNSKYITKNATRTEHLHTHVHNMGDHTIILWLHLTAKINTGVFPVYHRTLAQGIRQVQKYIHKVQKVQ